MRDLEFAWATLPRRARWTRARSRESDPRLLTRAILGLYNSIWQWFRPEGIVALQRVADFYNERDPRHDRSRPDRAEPTRLAA